MSELEKAEKRLAQAKARVQAIKARQSVKERKMDTRRKIILGGALMALVKQGDETASNLTNHIINTLPRDKDRELFEGTNYGRKPDTS